MKKTIFVLGLAFASATLFSQKLDSATIKNIYNSGTTTGATLYPYSLSIKPTLSWQYELLWTSKEGNKVMTVIRDTLTVYENDTLRVIKIYCRKCKISVE